MTLIAHVLVAASGTVPGLQVLPPQARVPAALDITADRSTPYRPGDSVRAVVRTLPGDHLTVLRVDTEGRVRVLFPPAPGEGGAVSAAAAGAMGQGLLPPFRAGPRPGTGYLVAARSPQPFDYRSISREGHWDQGAASRTRLVGNPVAGLLAFLEPLATSVTLRVVPYHVGGEFPHPRFACTGCHQPTADWDPYGARCRYVDLEADPSPPAAAWVTADGPLPGFRLRAVTGRAEAPDHWSGLRALRREPAATKAGHPDGLRPAISTGPPDLRRRPKVLLPAGSPRRIPGSARPETPP